MIKYFDMVRIINDLELLKLENINLKYAIEKLKTIFNYEIQKNNMIEGNYKYKYFELDKDNIRFQNE